MLLQAFKDNNYSVLELLLTPLQFHIPNSRLRYYFLAKAKPLSFSGVDPLKTQVIWRHIPGHGNPWIDDREKTDVAVAQIRSYLDPDIESADHSYSIKDRVLLKWGRIFDIVLPNSRRTCCFTRGILPMS